MDAVNKYKEKEKEAIDFTDRGLLEIAKITALLTIAEQLSIMNNNNETLYGTALRWNRDVK